MTDREMLLMAYGALRICVEDDARLKEITQKVEDHLYPTPYPHEPEIEAPQV